jgi:glycosyltransferase involved in cell wall biosynthesis
LNPRLVFDIDDALFANVTGLSYPMDSPEWQNWMTGFRAQLTDALHYSKIVTTSTEHVANFVQDYNSNITLLPDALDLKDFPLRTSARNSAPIVIGWTGRPENRVYVQNLEPVFCALAREYGDHIVLKIICKEPLELEGIRVTYQLWCAETEMQDLQSFDIAIRPLLDDEWSRGKGNFTAVQYMALGLPVVLSPVGANAYVVRDGVDGFLANSTEEWVEKLGRLVRDAELRQRIGLAGRKTAEEKFSVEANLPVVADVIRKVSARP